MQIIWGKLRFCNFYNFPKHCTKQNHVRTFCRSMSFAYLSKNKDGKKHQRHLNLLKYTKKWWGYHHHFHNTDRDIWTKSSPDWLSSFYLCLHSQFYFKRHSEFPGWRMSGECFQRPWGWPPCHQGYMVLMAKSWTIKVLKLLLPTPGGKAGGAGKVHTHWSGLLSHAKCRNILPKRQDTNYKGRLGTRQRLAKLYHSRAKNQEWLLYFEVVEIYKKRIIFHDMWKSYEIQFQCS